MRKVTMLLLAVSLAGCAGPEPELGVVRVKSGLWEGKELLEFHYRTIYSQCVLDGLEKFSEFELNAWRQSFCDQDIYPSALECSSMEVVSNEDRFVFKYFDVGERSEDTDFILGPIPTPESMDCDPYIELAGVYFRTPTTHSASGSRPGAVFPKARADGKRY